MRLQTMQMQVPYVPHFKKIELVQSITRIFVSFLVILSFAFCLSMPRQGPGYVGGAWHADATLSRAMIPLRDASSDELDEKVDKMPLDSVPMAKEMLECLVWDASAMAATVHMVQHVSRLSRAISTVMTMQKQMLASVALYMFSLFSLFSFFIFFMIFMWPSQDGQLLMLLAWSLRLKPCQLNKAAQFLPTMSV